MTKIMTHDEFEARMQLELAIPFWTLKRAQLHFTEEEFQEMKLQLTQDIQKYAEDYVDPSEN
ncbi:MAG: hypothetical protein LBI13_05190 [Streptococcaceae bacterium]|jgi:hypothetical protein|nr:hypothetical protein [Streptococcaceae bacterium]